MFQTINSYLIVLKKNDIVSQFPASNLTMKNAIGPTVAGKVSGWLPLFPYCEEYWIPYTVFPVLAFKNGNSVRSPVNGFTVV